MISRFAAAVVVLLLAGCDPVGDPAATSTPTPSVSASSTPEASEEPTDEGTGGGDGDGGVAQQVVDPNTYLIAGGLNSDPDGDGFWSAHYAFFNDDTHAIRCDIWIFSGDGPYAGCGVTPGNEGLVTYDLPADAQCDLSTSNPHDGYSIALGAKGADTAAAFSGCLETRDYQPEDMAVIKVLGEGQQITVDPFGCVTNGHATSCYYLDDSAQFTFGLFVAAHAG